MRQVAYGRKRTLGGLAVLFLAAAGGGAASAQAQPDCFNREMVMPAVVSDDKAGNVCHSKIDENKTSDQHAIALSNAARLYNAAANTTSDAAQKADYYAKAVADIKESRNRASDTNQAFTKPWKKGNKKAEAAQMLANKKFLVGRSYQLAWAYFGLSKLSSFAVCADKDDCLGKAVEELNRDNRQQTALEAGYDTYDDFLLLRGMAYLDWGRTADAKRDFEIVDDRPRYKDFAQKALGSVYIADGKRELRAPVTPAKLDAARSAFRNALRVEAVALDGQIGLGETYLVDARLDGSAAERRQKYVDAQREYGVAVTTAQQKGPPEKEALGLEGRGQAYLEQSALEKGDLPKLQDAINDLERAAGLDKRRVEGQLLYAQALARAGRLDNADTAFAEAIVRLGSDPRASNVRMEQAYYKGKYLFDQSRFAEARSAFTSALGQGGADAKYRADLFYLLSIIDLRIAAGPPIRPLADAAITNAEQANSAGASASPYREQLCFARIVQGGEPLMKQTGPGACAGSDFLQGMYYLRYAQYVPAAADKRQARIMAQDAFHRTRSSAVTLSRWPGSKTYAVADLAELGKAVALGCASGLPVPSNLDDAKLKDAMEFFAFYRVDGCRSN